MSIEVISKHNGEVRCIKHKPPLQAVRFVNVLYFYTTYPPEFYRPIVRDEAEKE